MPGMKHQLISLDFMADRDEVIDASDPGTGKTFVGIEDFAAHYDGTHPGLILAPKSLLESAWKDDFTKFRPELNVSVAWAENREKAFATPADVYVTNIDGVTWLAKQRRPWFKKFSRLYIDESTKFKHPDSQRSKAAKYVASQFKVRRAMSGSFYGNSILDCFHQVLLVDGGKSLGKSYYQFRASVTDCVMTGPKGDRPEWVEREHSRAAVAALISHMTIRHVFEECIDIPPNHNYSLAFHMPKKLATHYWEMANIKATVSDRLVSTLGGGSVNNKLLQIASGAVYADGDEEGMGDYTLLDNSRYLMVADLVEERKHGIVFFLWRHQRDELIKEFKKRGIHYCVYDGTVGDKERAQIKRDFQAGFYQAMLAHPDSAGHGLTLTKGTYTLWPSPTGNHEWFLQGMRRVYRNTQTQKTENITIVAKDTVEEETYARCLRRGDNNNELNSYLE